MITNILAAVAITLITNVVSSDNSSGCPMYHEGQMPLVYGHVCTPFHPPTERYQTTNVTERTTVTLTLSGMQRTFTEDKLLSSVTAVWRKSDEWQEAGVKTNPPPVSVSLSLTNWIWDYRLGPPSLTSLFRPWIGQKS